MDGARDLGPGFCCISPTTNQITGVSYDGNGNVTQFGPPPGYALAYDVANRLATVNTTSAYAYDSTNLRTYYRNSAGLETIYLYGVDQKKMATYTISLNSGKLTFNSQTENVYFAGRLISAENNAVALDGLGSVLWNSAYGSHAYSPYGAEYVASSNDTEKYATYTRDSLTELDYALNRYYLQCLGPLHVARPHDGERAARQPTIVESIHLR